MPFRCDEEPVHETTKMHFILTNQSFAHTILLTSAYVRNQRIWGEKEEWNSNKIILIKMVKC
jgi:hypothetical protein